MMVMGACSDDNNGDGAWPGDNDVMMGAWPDDSDGGVASTY